MQRNAVFFFIKGLRSNGSSLYYSRVLSVFGLFFFMRTPEALNEVKSEKSPHQQLP